MSDESSKGAKAITLRLTPMNIGVFVFIAILSFGLGLLFKSSGNSSINVSPNTAQNAGGQAGENTAEEPPELRGVIEAVDGNVITISGLTAFDSTAELPSSAKYLISAETSVVRHAHKSESEIAKDRVDWETANARHITAEEAGGDLTNLPYLDTPPDTHNYTELTLADVRTGQYVAVGSDNLVGLGSKTITATYLLLDEVPIAN